MFASGAADLLNAAIQAGQGVPEMEESILLKADVDEHRFETLLDVLYFALKDAADDVTVGISLNIVFFQNAVFQECDSAFQFFTTDNNLIANFLRIESEKLLHFF